MKFFQKNWHSRIHEKSGDVSMIKSTLFLAAILISSSASAQTPLTAYADKDGYINIQKLTCAQLAGTFQEDADMLATWYSGWYNGLAKAHRAKITRVKEDQHAVIVYCKANPNVTIIKAIDKVFKSKK